MPDVRPFKGLRPAPELAEKVAAPPYDVLNSEEARELVKDNPYSYLHVSKPEIDLPAGIDQYDQRVYEKGVENFQKMIADKILIQDDKPCFYIYRQIMGDHEQTGIVAAASVEDYDSGIIKIHEYTRQDKEQDRAKHVDMLGANTGPVFLTYHAKQQIDSIVEACKKEDPLYDFTSSDGIRHTLWSVNDETMIGQIIREFDALDYLYVSDGHHRSAAASRVQKIRKENNPDHTGDEEYNYFLTVIFPDDQMYIMDYNRVVKDLNGLSDEDFIKKVSEKFMVERQASHYKPEKKHTFGMYIDGNWYKLTAKPGIFDENDPVESLDVSILHRNIMEPLLGIVNPRKDKRIDFVGGIRGLNELEKLVDSGKFHVAFAFFPTSIDDLMKVADSNNVMPPKSTWFEPKLRSGLITHLL
ncbi:MAG: DUF1015 domain-containing protein [Candidatus Cloacimonetes bacterium]|nr:DUF1015 domain-containing protein [Candidatus Cloacimonadota bacterium]